MTEQNIAAPDRWFVAKTRPNGEQKALFHLRRQGFDVYLPQFVRRISHARRISWQPRPLFPSYLFVAMSEAQQRWRAINSTIGISRRHGGSQIPNVAAGIAAVCCTNQ